MDEIRATSARNAQISRERIKRASQLTLFPNWPEDRRGAPTQVVRSAIFGVVQRGKRERVIDMPVAGPSNTTITITGWRLDQNDMDVWLEVMHLARRKKPGESVRFSLHSMLKRLEKLSDGGTAFKRLTTKLKSLAETTIAYDGPKSVGVAGALIASFAIDKETGEAVVETNPKIRPLFESVAWLDVEERRSLRGSQLAKALHAALAAYPEWTPMRLDTLMPRVGAEYKRIRDFKGVLETVLNDFQRRGWIRGYHIGTGDGGLVEIDKVPTPTQARALGSRSGAGDNPQP